MGLITLDPGVRIIAGIQRSLGSMLFDFVFFPYVHEPGGQPSFAQEWGALKAAYTNDMQNAMAMADQDQDQVPPRMPIQVDSYGPIYYFPGAAVVGVYLMCFWDCEVDGGYYYFTLPDKPDEVTGPVQGYYKLDDDKVFVTIQVSDWGNRVRSQTFRPPSTPWDPTIPVPPNCFPRGSFGGSTSAYCPTCSQLTVYWSLIDTLAATLVSDHSARLNGDDADCTDVHFEWGKITEPVTAHVTANQQGASFHADIAGLAAGTVYQFRAVGTYGDITVYGAILMFQTQGIASTVTTKPATNIVTTEAHLNGSYIGTDQAYLGFEFTRGSDKVYYYAGVLSPMEAPFVGMAAHLAPMTPLWIPGPITITPSARPFGYDVHGLMPGQGYSFRAFAALFDRGDPNTVYEIIWGQSLSFTTFTIPVPIRPNKNYPTAREAVDSLQIPCLGRCFMDDQGQINYQGRYARG